MSLITDVLSSVRLGLGKTPERTTESRGICTLGKEFTNNGRRRTDGETATEDGRTRGGRTDFFFATLTSPFLEFLLPSLARSFRPSVRLAR